jgi:phage gpG-like protein
MSQTIELKDKGLKQLQKAFKGKMVNVRVGILGKTTTRSVSRGTSGQVNTNATIGAVHEFGLGGMPVRSFLRMPLIEHLNKRLESSGAFEKSTLNAVVQSGTLKPWMNKVGVVAVGVVREAFATSGFGKWKTSNMSRKKVKQTLTETGQLRKSITWDVT